MSFEEEDRSLQGKVLGNSHFLLIAKNQVGLNNLFEMISLLGKTETLKRLEAAVS